VQPDQGKFVKGILFVAFKVQIKNNLMSADQTRKNKKVAAGDKRSNRGTNRAPVAKPNETDQSLHKPYHGYDEEKISGTDYSQQIGEYSDWRKTG